MGTQVDITVSEHWHPGEDKSHQIDVVDSVGTAVAMTGWALKYSIRRTKGAATLSPFTNKSIGSGITIGTSGTGATADDRATVDIDAADTTGLRDIVWYVLERTDSGNKGILAEGQIPFDYIGI